MALPVRRPIGGAHATVESALVGLSAIMQPGALVSWCPDLTDPSQSAVPLAVLLVARSEDLCYATSVGFTVDAKVDPLTAAVLRDVPVVIRSHVDAIVRERPGIDTVLEHLAASLRGSLHVASISPESELSVEDEVGLVREAKRILVNALRCLAQGEDPAAPKRTRVTSNRPSRRALFSDQLPAMQQWQLEGCTAPPRLASTL